VNRIAGDDPVLPPGLKFHALRHTYASLCVAAGIPPLQLSRFMGHAKVTTTLAIYTHLFDDDHAETMAALAAMSRPVQRIQCGAYASVPEPASSPVGSVSVVVVVAAAQQRDHRCDARDHNRAQHHRSGIARVEEDRARRAECDDAHP
jgi:hypothetical protein